jgi:eukaryotic-like serine/threonine-protein kinase
MDMPTEAYVPATSKQIGHYDLLAKIAEGGMGAVYKGRSQITGEIVAIKIIPAETAKNPILVKRFEQEFKAASLLDHPNIVKAIEYNAATSTPFLVMEFVDGDSLGRKVEREGPMPEDVALSIIAQVCEGLHRAHKQGLIHRDVKPDNILVTADGVAKLTDLGLVKEVEGDLNLTKTGRGLGTPHFMAPEQFRNAKNADVRCDIYSLGATLYMMLTGSVPFAKTNPLDCWMKKIKNDFPPPRKVVPTLSDRVNWATLRAMSADPDKRPSSCREFIEDLTGQAWQGWTAQPRSGVNPAPPPEAAAKPSTPGLWYLVYKNKDGQPQKVKGTTESIRQNLKARALGDTSGIVVCRTKNGPFVPLKNVPEFRDMIVGPGSVDASRASGKYRTPPPAEDTVKNLGKTIPQPPRKSTSDPQADVATEVHAVDPVKSKPTKTSKSKSALRPDTTEKSTSQWPWIFVAAVLIATVIGIIVGTQ